MGGLNLVPYMKIFEARRVRITTMTRVRRAQTRDGNRLLAILHSPYAETDVDERLVDQVVVENATLPLAELYFALKEKSSNRGAVDYPALLRGRQQNIGRNAAVPSGSSASAMRSPRAISTPPSMTPCGCARIFDRAVFLLVSEKL